MLTGGSGRREGLGRRAGIQGDETPQGDIVVYFASSGKDALSWQGDEEDGGGEGGDGGDAVEVIDGNAIGGDIVVAWMGFGEAEDALADSGMEKADAKRGGEARA